MKGKLRIAALFICVVFLFASVACGAPSAAYVLTLKDEVFRAPLYIGKAYSIDNVVEKEAGVNYTIKQLFTLTGNSKSTIFPMTAPFLRRTSLMTSRWRSRAKKTAVRTAKWWKSRSISTRTPFWTHL
ncbi:MAG: hypothetical protein ACLR06_10070 [Christensenellaceae bacterium]